MASLLFIGTLLLTGALPALSSPVLENRATLVCNRNYLNRCFSPTGTKPTDSASRSAATAYCSSFLSIPVVTSYIATTTPVTSSTTTTTAIDSTETDVSIVTETTTVSGVVTDVEKRAAQITDAPRPIAGHIEFVAKRAAGVAPPACLTSTISTSYAPSQVSSACACLSITPSTTYVTSTAPVTTSVSTSVAHTTSTTSTVTTTTATTTATPTDSSDPPCSTGTEVIANQRRFCVLHEEAIGTYKFDQLNTDTLEECIDSCSTYTNPNYGPCIAVDYLRAAQVCQRLSGDELGFFADPGWDVAFLSTIPPPS